MNGIINNEEGSYQKKKHHGERKSEIGKIKIDPKEVENGHYK